MDHADKIMVAMSARKMTTGKLAILSGIPIASILHIITRQRTMTVLNAMRIANVLKNVTARHLLIAQIDYKLKHEAFRVKRN